MTVTDTSQQFKAAFITQAVAAVADTSVWVGAGTPFPNMPDDIVSVNRITAAQDMATMGTTRSRNLNLILEVTVSVFRGGGVEMESVASARAYSLLNTLEEMVRPMSGDTTVGGTVQWCFLTAHDGASETDPNVISKGRIVEIVAQFSAFQRITS